MPVMREVLRLVGQVIAFSVLTRRLGLVVLIAVGAVLVATALATSAAAPILIYPVL